ncbi:MAG: hypothetical protein KFF73_16010 [Cyclobacteriaceae bacterium]|nr:hypothetical protein [Cyclobacteriaceae bacterium]
MLLQQVNLPSGFLEILLVITLIVVIILSFIHLFKMIRTDQRLKQVEDKKQLYEIIAFRYQKIFEALEKIYALGPNPSLAYKMDANLMIIQDKEKNEAFIAEIESRWININRMLTSVRPLISEDIYKSEKEFFESESKLEQHLQANVTERDSHEIVHELTDKRIEGEQKVIRILQEQLRQLTQQVELSRVR